MENKYEIVKKGIKDDIIGGKYNVGDKLPTESELMVAFQVSRYTIRRAIGELQNEHFVNRIQGGGMFVNDWQNQRESQINHKMIGVITTHIADYIFPSIISGIDRILSSEGYSIILSNTHNNHDKERQSIISMLDNNVDGLIIEPTQSALPNPNVDLYRKINLSGLPTIFINANYPTFDFPYVGTTDKETEKKLTDFLFENGHERILGVFQIDDLQGVHRMEGFLQSYMEHPELSYLSESVMFQSNDEMSKIFDKIAKILSRPDRPTAIACYNDQLAIQLMDVIKSLDLRIPEDVSIVGFDDYQLSKYMDPSLTTVEHPKITMGIDAGKLMLKMLNKEEISSIVYESKLIKRESTSKIKK